MNQQRPSKTTEHYTPEWVIQLARNMFLGNIDLDPASSLVANTIIKANRIYTEIDNGLSQSWNGNVFCNPPGSPSKWFKKSIEEYRLGNLKQLFFVVYSIDRLPTILKVCHKEKIGPTVIVPHNRVEYLDCVTLQPQTDPLHGSAFIYIGPRDISSGSTDGLTTLNGY